MIPNNKLFQFMKDNLHLKKYKIEELPTDLVEEIRRTFQIFDVDNGEIWPFIFKVKVDGQNNFGKWLGKWMLQKVDSTRRCIVRRKGA